MVPSTFMGLPLHILLVHFVVVLTPLTCLAVLLHALWPAAARRLGVVTPLGALVVMVLTPITTSAGEQLEEKTGITPAIERHAELGETLKYWVIPLFIVALVLWVFTRWGADRLARRLTPTAVLGIRLVIMIAALVVAVGTAVDVVLIGDAGARAVWGPLYSK